MYRFSLPIYFIQGEEDILTPKELTAAYFKKIIAPSKELIMLPSTDHGYTQAAVDAQYKIVRQVASTLQK